jgi:hypothetical protein
MNVYPVNLMNGAALSGNALPHSDVHNVFHKYLKHRAYFPANEDPAITVGCGWLSEIQADSIIIADTNCAGVSLTIYSKIAEEKTVRLMPQQTEEIISLLPQLPENKVFLDSDTFTFSARLSLSAEINIVEIKEIEKVPEITKIYKMEFVFSGCPENEEPYVGYIFAGKKVTLPRFTVNPSWGIEIRGAGERTNNGQAYGNILPTLDRLSVSFARVDKDKKKIVDGYARSVQASVPHVVDLYPGARADFPPRYATLDGNVDANKRPENGFYYNFNLAWKEAR